MMDEAEAVVGFWIRWWSERRGSLRLHPSSSHVSGKTIWQTPCLICLLSVGKHIPNLHSSISTYPYVRVSGRVKNMGEWCLSQLCSWENRLWLLMDTKSVQRKPYLHQPESLVTHTPITHTRTNTHTYTLTYCISLSLSLSLCLISGGWIVTKTTDRLWES